MSLQGAYHHLSEEKRAAIMALAREGFSGAHIARRCGISEATVSREFSRQFPQGIPLKERRKRYEAAAAHTRYRENRKKSKPRGKLGSSVFFGKIGVVPACRSPSPPVGFTVILAGQKGLGMNTKIHPNCNLTATLQSRQAADART